MVDTANDVAVEKGIPADAKQVDINFVNAILQAMQNNLNSLMAQKVRLEANEIILTATVKELQEKNGTVGLPPGATPKAPIIKDEPE
jgi:post-segregation antitoxin (ccd killing protein)|tara:strand:- start:1530 stop:1790 length:261 start_codon:yes stop_codon:yes gene_type:complete